MYGDKLNNHTNELIAEFNKTHLFDYLTTGIFGVILVICLAGILYVISNKTTVAKVGLLLVSFSAILIGTFAVYSKYEDVTVKSVNFKNENLFTDGSNTVAEDINSAFYDKKSKKYFAKYIEGLETKTSKSYSDIQYLGDTQMTFYFKGTKYTVKNPSLLNIKENKKPIMTYKVVDRDIYGLLKKGDIINIDFVVNY